MDELARLMKVLGKEPNEADLQRMIQEIDLNANGKIDYDEFVELMRKPISKEDSDSELEAAFGVFDKDGSGSISPSELKRTMRELGEKLDDEDIDEMIRQADVNEEGEIILAGTFLFAPLFSWFVKGSLLSTAEFKAVRIFLFYSISFYSPF